MVNGNRNTNQNRNQGKGNGKGGGPPRGPPQRARGQPQRQNIVRNRPQVPRGLPPNHHFNAFGPQKPQALAFSVGPATHLGGLASISDFTSALQPTMWIFQPSGGYNQLGKCVTTDSGATFSWGNNNIDSTGIDNTGGGPSSGSPTQVLCSRGSIRVRNCSRAADAGGIVRVLRTGTPLSMTGSELGYLYDMVKNHPRTHTYTGSALTKAHQWDCIPVDQTSYAKFIPPTQAYSLLNGGDTPAVSSIIIIFEAFATVQNIELTMAACYYGRYRFAGPLASMASLPPTISLGITNMIRDAAEALGSAGRVVGNELLGRGAQRAISAGEGYLGNLFNQNLNPGRLGGRWSTVQSIEEVAGPLALGLA